MKYYYVTKLEQRSMQCSISYYLCCIISIIRWIVEYIFIINLFKDMNVANILYKSSQSCDTYFGTDGVFVMML